MHNILYKTQIIIIKSDTTRATYLTSQINFQKNNEKTLKLNNSLDK